MIYVQLSDRGSGVVLRSDGGGELPRLAGISGRCLGSWFARDLNQSRLRGSESTGVYSLYAGLVVLETERSCEGEARIRGGWERDRAWRDAGGPDTGYSGRERTGDVGGKSTVAL